MSLVDFLSKTSPNDLPLGKNGISSLWTCGQCCQTFLSNTELQVHLNNNHKTKCMPPLGNHVKPVIANTKKRQSPQESPASKRVKRSASPNPPWFVFNPASMQQIASNGNKFYKCDICEQLFGTSDGTGFKIHYLRSHINYQFISSSDRVLCSIVDDGLKSKVTDHLYRCYYCNISCAEKQVLIDHNAEHKSNVFRCVHCHAVFYQNKAFTNHTKNCTKAPSATPPLTMCLFCKEPTMFDDRDVHTRKYHCYVNAVLRVECVWGCNIKMKKLSELFKHCVSVHKDEYFACVMCKVRFHTSELLNTHNKTKHNIDTPLGDKKPNLALTNKLDKIKSKPERLTSPGDGIISKSSTQSVKLNAQLTGKTNGQSASLKTNGQSAAVKPNKQSSLPLPSSSTLSPQQRYFQDILFKSILKIDLIEQVNVLKKHAVQYPGMLRLPEHPVFASTLKDAPCPHCPNPGEEEFLRPVFSSSHDNNVYICKACGLQTVSQGDMTAHMTSVHPLIHNDCYVFSKEDLPEGLWSLSQPPDVKSTVRTSLKSRGLFKCTCCAFECRDNSEFHKHLLQCAKKQKFKTEVQARAKQGTGTGGVGKKEESPRRRMVITGVLRQVPDDPLFSYKKELEKTIRKPGDSETVFNMLNKLPSKRLVKTTERYDSLFYKNNKAMKPKRSSLERLTQVLNDRDLCYSLSDYLKYFINKDSQHSNQIEEISNTSPSQSDKSRGEMSKVVMDRKPKVAKTSVSSEELNKSTGDKKVKVTKPVQTQSKDTKTGEKRVKSPKLEDNKQNGDGKKCKVPKMNNVDEKKVKAVKQIGASDNNGRKMNGQLYSPATKGFMKETVPKAKFATDTPDLDIFREEASSRVKHDEVSAKSLQNVKVVQLHYPTNLNHKSQHSPPLPNTTKCKGKTIHLGNKTKNILVEKKGKNLNSNNASAAGVKKKGKHGLNVKKKFVVTKRNRAGNSGQLIKVDTKTKAINCDKPNVVAPLRESPPRKKKTTRIVVVSDGPLVPLLTMKKDKKI
ncbi:hypothetical protein WDU94_012837 [Cyamophila willieti]